jgi:hypothetical protein
MMTSTLKRRVARLEAVRGGQEVTLEEMILWSYEKEPYDAETQRRYDDFARRRERSKLWRLMAKSYQRSGGTADPSRAPGVGYSITRP